MLSCLQIDGCCWCPDQIADELTFAKVVSRPVFPETRKDAGTGYSPPWEEKQRSAPKQEAKAEKEGPVESGGTFEVTLNRGGDENKPLGLGIRVDAERAALRILMVNEEGAVAEWNKDHPERAVSRGDFVLQVNDKVGSAREMMHEFAATKTNIYFRVLRP
eukprot:CAMPEP_0194534664 /NCGR_PEP_ID=MMETSP0253-20130528/72957_1 /TAXON_ID=2966 /ORGANISM="Noctiluca scintillans" /LENGTH=160 /DNA_ID=CAMNT_0039380361 /DNA_START=90 /DNA_END=572 /DNA_ORIENTATION=+